MLSLTDSLALFELAEPDDSVESLKSHEIAQNAKRATASTSSKIFCSFIFFLLNIFCFIAKYFYILNGDYEQSLARLNVQRNLSVGKLSRLFDSVFIVTHGRISVSER